MADAAKEISGPPIDLGSGGREPRRVKLLPMGEVRMRDGRGPYYVRDRAHAERIIAATRAYYGSSDMSFDYGHAAQKDQAFIAAGWIKTSTLSVEPDGIYAWVEWTPRAAQQIRAGEYRYLSPLFRANNANGDVVSITNAALVNMGAIDLPAVAASLRMGFKFDGQELKALTLEELKDAAAGSPVDVQMALTPTEQMEAQKIGVSFADYLAQKIRQKEAEGVAAALSPEERTVAAMMNISEADWIAARDEISPRNHVAAGARFGLSKEEAWAARVAGVSPAQFAAAKTMPAGGDHIAAAAQFGLNKDEAEVCRLMNITPSQFLAAKRG